MSKTRRTLKPGSLKAPSYALGDSRHHRERGLYAYTLAAVRKAFVIRHSSVVLSDMRRGARTQEARRLVDSLHRPACIQREPSAADWWEAGRLIRNIGDDQRWDRSKRRDFQNDVLIGLTAHHRGATVVTADHRDFEYLARTLRFPILLV